MKNVNQSADYFEPLLRGRVVRAMKQLRDQVSINDLAMAMGNARQATALVTAKAIREALAPTAKVMKDAVRQGGRIGAEKVRKAVK